MTVAISMPVYLETLGQDDNPHIKSSIVNYAVLIQILIEVREPLDQINQIHKRLKLILVHL